MKNRPLIAACLPIILSMLLSSCSHGYNPLDKVKSIPRDSLVWLESYDGASGYKNHKLTSDEKDLIQETFRTLPPVLQEALENDVYAIYFVDGMWYGALTSRIPDLNQCIIFINPDTLSTSLSEWLTYRDNTIFSDASDTSCFVSGCGKKGEKYTGFLHTLTHELAHVYDYIDRVTPYVEDGMKDNIKADSLFYDTWKDRTQPRNGYGTSQLEQVAFYGFGGCVSSSLAAEMLGWLSSSPFSSLYGATNWADDFAETLTYYWLNKKLGLDYEVTYLQNGQETAHFTWSESEAAKRWKPLCKEICGK
ncbi:MAG: hypothetical protein KBT02_04450 [Treponema sp.]|nr:hypothetical protein [Candidatus Treponema caballi]